MMPWMVLLAVVGWLCASAMPISRTSNTLIVASQLLLVCSVLILVLAVVAQ